MPGPAALPATRRRPLRLRPRTRRRPGRRRPAVDDRASSSSRRSRAACRSHRGRGVRPARPSSGACADPHLIPALMARGVRFCVVPLAGGSERPARCGSWRRTAATSPRADRSRGRRGCSWRYGLIRLQRSVAGGELDDLELVLAVEDLGDGAVLEHGAERARDERRDREHLQLADLLFLGDRHRVSDEDLLDRRLVEPLDPPCPRAPGGWRRRRSGRRPARQRLAPSATVPAVRSCRRPGRRTALHLADDGHLLDLVGLVGDRRLYRNARSACRYSRSRSAVLMRPASGATTTRSSPCRPSCSRR